MIVYSWFIYSFIHSFTFIDPQNFLAIHSFPAIHAKSMAA